MLSSILRIIEGTQNGDVDKVIRYAKKILPEEELKDELTEKCIREKFDPNAGHAVMDDTPFMDRYYLYADEKILQTSNSLDIITDFYIEYYYEGSPYHNMYIFDTNLNEIIYGK